MGQYIKKVGVTPVRGNGFIVNSFATSDNKQFNAPSLDAVLGRTDNNLLENGLICEGNAGWKISAGSASTGSGYFAGPYGANFTPGFLGNLASTEFSSGAGQVEQDGQKFSVTIAYAIYQGSPAGNPISYAYLDDITFKQNLDNSPRLVDEQGIEIKLSAQLLNKLNINIKNTGSKSVQIMAVKLERGSVHTPIVWFSKDTGASALYKNLEGMFKIKTFNFTGLSISAVGQSITEDITVNGYIPVGVIGWSASSGLSARELRTSVYFTNISKLYMFLNNHSGSAISTGSMLVYILYVSSGMYGTLVDTTVGP